MKSTKIPGESILNTSLKPYVVFAMFIVYVGAKPVAGLVKATFAQEIRGVDFSMTLLIGVYIFIKITEMYTSRHSLWMRTGFIILMLIIIIQLASYPVVMSYGNQYIFEYYTEFFSTVTRFCILLWIVGGNVDKLLNIVDKRWAKRTVFIIYYLFIILLFIHKHMYFVDEGPGSTIFGWAEYPSEYYLYFGDIFALFTLWVVNISKSGKAKLALSVNGIYWLYLIGSRTSLYCCCMVLAIVVIRHTIKNKRAAAAVMIVLCLAAYGLYSNIEAIMDSSFLSINNRMMRGLVAADQDGSLQYRQIQLNGGLEDIKDYWLTGRFLREYERTGEPGNYIHNILSYWAAYGVLPFVIILSLAVLSLAGDSIKFFKYKDNILVNYVFCTSAFIIISALVSRSYGYPYIWFALSMSSRLHECMEEGGGYLQGIGGLSGGENKYDEGVHAAQEGAG